MHRCVVRNTSPMRLSTEFATALLKDFRHVPERTSTIPKGNIDKAKHTPNHTARAPAVTQPERDPGDRGSSRPPLMANALRGAITLRPLEPVPGGYEATH